MLKKMMKAVALSAFAAVASAAIAHAQFPARRIQIIYPWTPGTPTYAVSQIIADAMGKELGVNMPVVAKTGASGVNAFQQALNEPADGYTLIDGYVAPLIISPLFKKANWTCGDFTPLYSATSNAFAVVSRADEKRWTDFPSFIAYLKAHPGKTRYTGSAELSLPHMVMAKALETAGAVARNVPYNDLADGTKDLRSGLLDWMVVNPGIYRANKANFRVLAVLSDLKEVSKIYDGAKRAGDFGIKLGLTGLAPMGWDWWLLKKGTPEPVVKALRGAMGKALARPDVHEKILKIGFVPTGYTPAQYDKVCNNVRSDLKSAMDAVTWEKDQLKKLQ